MKIVPMPVPWKTAVAWLLAGLAMTALIGWFDEITGPDLFFAPFYILPVALVTWRAGAVIGLATSLGSVVTWSLVGEFQGPHSSAILLYLNEAIRFGSYLGVVFLLAALKTSEETLEERVRIRTAELTTEVTERKAAERALERSGQELRNLAARIESIREEERSHIAREVHDRVGQALSVLNMDIMRIQAKLRGGTDPALAEQVQGRLKSMENLVVETSDSVQRICEELRPGVLDDLGLVAAIDWQAQEFKSRTGIGYQLICDRRNIGMDKERATAAFRIFQEILTNIARHAKANAIQIRLRKDAGKVVLEVRDNGKGITEEDIQNHRSYGILGMRERASLLGGEFTISSISPTGTLGRLSFPLDTQGPRQGNPK